MTTVSKFMLVTLILLVAVASVSAQSEEGLNSIARSRIEANVPDSPNFEKFLKRDLAAYFKELRGKDVTVEFELLRSGPTQTGIAFPKFYAWVIVRDKESIVDQGVVRLAASEKKQFQVTHFLSKSEINTTASTSKIFPPDVAKRIEAKLHTMEH